MSSDFTGGKSSRASHFGFSEAMRLAVWCGLAAGLAEGVIDLTVAHYHVPAMLSLSALVYPFLFLAVGVLAWLASAWLGGRARRAVFFALVAGTAAYSIGRAAGTFAPQWEAGVSAAGIAVMAAILGTRWAGAAMRVVRRTLPWMAAAALIFVVAIPVWGRWAARKALAQLPAVSSPRPNVLLVIVDTLRADHLRVYGYERHTSPNIDRLASHGTLFDTAISASSWTLPSHATMMTGVYPHVHGVVSTKSQLAPHSLTLPWVLRQDGYRTAAFSANSFFFNRRYGLGQGFLHFGDYFFSPGDALNQLALVRNVYDEGVRLHWRQNLLGRQSAEDINRAALTWILAHPRRPFFVALNYLDAHDPYLPPPPYRRMFSQHNHPGGRINIGVNLLPHLSPAELHEEMDAYDGGIRYVDTQIGRLLVTLQMHALLRDTLVIIVGDHGEAFGEHGLIAHANALYFPLIHVPLIFLWPGHVPAGVRVARPVSTKDIGATVLGLVGDSGRAFPGKSLAALWNGDIDISRWPLPLAELAETHFERSFPDYYGPLEAIVSPTLEYIIDPREGPLLYDWKTDPEELNNLVGDPHFRRSALQLAMEMRYALHTAP